MSYANTMTTGMMADGGAELDLSGIDERDVRFIAYLEGDLTPGEREAFEAELDDDAELRADYETFADIMGASQSLPFEFAPDDFVERVQSRIRSRSAGRFFEERWLHSTRVPYEAIAVVMIAIMAAAYILMGAPSDAGLKGMPDVEVPLETPAKDRAPAAPSD